MVTDYIKYNRKDWFKKYRNDKLNNGKCSKHPLENIIPGTKYCNLCKISIKERKKRLIKNGKCSSHPNENIVPGKTCCQKCLDYMKIAKEKRIRSGKCGSHPNRDVIPGRKRCWECLWNGILRIHNLTNEEATKQLEKQNYTCPLSGRKLEKGINASPDHVMQKCNGGKLDISNIRFVDTSVNLLRNRYSDEELIEFCREVANYNKKKY